MGLRNSLPQSDLVQQYRPQEWSILNRTMQYEIWQHRLTDKKYMAYPLELQQDPYEAINIFEFRRMHSNELIAPEVILQNKKDYVCVQENSYHLLIENIPVSLSHINPRLNIQERFSILAVVFSALNTLNYRYGPVFLTENMITFTEKGRVKIWVNDRLSSNAPSFLTRNPSGAVMEGSTHFREQRTTFHCISEVFRILSNWKTDTFPLDFRQQAVTLCTFEQSQQFVISYCRKNDIRLLKKIDYERYVVKKRQINLISADPDNFQEQNDRKDRSATTLNRITPPSSLSGTPRNKNKKVTVLESVVHNRSTDLLANYEAMNQGNGQMPYGKQKGPKIPMIASRRQRRTVEEDQQPRIRVYAPIEADGPQFSFCDEHRSFSADPGRQDLRKTPAFRSKAHLPPLSPKRVSQVPSNPAIRVRSPEASKIDYQQIQMPPAQMMKFDKSRQSFEVVNSINPPPPPPSPMFGQQHNQQAWYPQAKRPPLEFPQPQVKYSQPPQTRQQSYQEPKPQMNGHYSSYPPMENNNYQNYQQPISQQPISQQVQYKPAVPYQQTYKNEPMRPQQMDYNRSLPQTERVEMSHPFESFQHQQYFQRNEPTDRKSNKESAPPSHHTTFLVQKSQLQINELDESSLVIYSNDMSDMRDDTANSNGLPYNPHNVSEAEAYLKGKYAQYLSKENKPISPQNRGQQLYQKYLNR